MAAVQGATAVKAVKGAMEDLADLEVDMAVRVTVVGWEGVSAERVIMADRAGSAQVVQEDGRDKEQGMAADMVAVLKEALVVVIMVDEEGLRAGVEDLKADAEGSRVVVEGSREAVEGSRAGAEGTEVVAEGSRAKAVIMEAAGDGRQCGKASLRVSDLRISQQQVQTSVNEHF